MAAVAGVDVSKDSLDVSVSEGPVLRFDNSAKGITKLLKHLAEQEATLAVCESTGGYERLLVSRLHKAELAVRVANPSRVRAFARACGYEAKTGPRDAQVLSPYGQVLPGPEAQEVDQEREEYQEALQKNAHLSRRTALYRSVPGVGPITAAILVAFLPKLGRWDSKALTSLVGLAPWSRDSGRKGGQRSVRGGRGVIRKALYPCACSVIQVIGLCKK